MTSRTSLPRPGLRPTTSRLACLLLCCAAAPQETPARGAAGLGDKYYPALGNGGYDAQHYGVVLDVDVEAGSIEAELAMRARATQALSAFHLDLFGLEVTSVLVDGKAAEFAREEQELVITPAKPLANGAEFTVEVAYRGTPTGVPDAGVPFVKEGVGWMQLKKGGSIVMSEPSGAHGWVPCNDHPQDKATWSFDVTVDAPWVVAANGLLKERVEHDGKITSRFEASDPMASYLATVCIGDFDVVESVGPNGLPIRNYFYKVEDDEKRAKSREGFEKTAEIVEVFSELFGPYPFECVGGVMVDQSVGGALECQTMPVYSRGVDAGTIAHELAHQWFGDSVSPAGWDHLWLNEGFATYAEWLWREHTDGKEALEERALAMYSAAHRMGPPGDTGPVIFGGSVYVRGAWTLQALRLAVGDEAFFTILRTWTERYHDGVADTQVFIALSEEISKQDLGDLFQAWLYAETPPDVEPYATKAAERAAEREAERERRRQEREEKKKAKEGEGGE